MGKIIDSDDLLTAIKFLSGMASIDEEQTSGMTEAMKALISITPEVKTEKEKEKEKETKEKSVMWKVVMMRGDALIFSCGDCGEKIITTKRIKAFSRCPYCGMRNKFPPSVAADGGMIF